MYILRCDFLDTHLRLKFGSTSNLLIGNVDLLDSFLNWWFSLCQFITFKPISRFSPDIYCSTRSQYPASSWWRPYVTSSRRTHSLEVKSTELHLFLIWFISSGMNVLSFLKIRMCMLRDVFSNPWFNVDRMLLSLCAIFSSCENCAVYPDREEAVWCVSALHGLGQTLWFSVVPEWPQWQLRRLEGNLHRQQQRCKFGTNTADENLWNDIDGHTW